MAHLLATHPDIDAVFAASDLMAAGAMAVLDGRRAPGPATTSPSSASTTRRSPRPPPQLTSVRQPIEEMGHEMARLLVEAVDASDPVPRRVILATELIQRASSAGRHALSRPATGGRAARARRPTQPRSQRSRRSTRDSRGGVAAMNRYSLRHRAP